MQPYCPTPVSRLYCTWAFISGDFLQALGDNLQHDGIDRYACPRILGACGCLGHAGHQRRYIQLNQDADMRCVIPRLQAVLCATIRR